MPSLVFILRWCFFTLLLLVPGIFIRAQVPACVCARVFDSLSRHLQINYPGYEKERVKNFVSPAFGPSTSKEACSKLLNQYVSQFGDGHLQIRYSGNVFEDENRNDAQPLWPDITEEKAKWMLDTARNLDSLEGIWESYDALYKVYIRKEGSIFVGYLLETVNQNWKKGEVKMIFENRGQGGFRLKYYLSSHKPRRHSFTQIRNILEIKNRIVFQKMYPAVSNPIPFESYVSGSFGVTEQFLQWDKETFYIQLQNITSGNKMLIDSLIHQNTPAILKSSVLVIDLRDNEGGDFTCFENLWPFVLTGPAVVYGTTFLCTAANVSAYQLQVQKLGTDIIPDFQQFAIEMNAHIGENWRVENETLYPSENAGYGPARVVLLVNGKCKSSTENFVLTARQSKKVTVAGTPTAGVADYEEVVDFQLACPELTLQMPIGKSNRLPLFPLDGVGIVPDILLSPGGGNGWQKWVGQVLKKLRR